MKGLEPPRLTAPDPKSGVATNYTTSAIHFSSFLVSANIETFDIPTKQFPNFFIFFEKFNLPFLLYTLYLLLLPLNYKTMELQGTIKKITDIQTFASGFQKREMILLTEEQYPQPISIEFLQDKADLVNNFNEGEKVKVSINIRGREWTSPQGEVKYFNSIVGWRIEKVAGDFNEPVQASPSQTAKPAETGSSVFEEEDDDLPF